MTLKEFKIQWALGTMSVQDIMEEVAKNSSILNFMLHETKPTSILSLFCIELLIKKVNKNLIIEKENKSDT